MELTVGKNFGRGEETTHQGAVQATSEILRGKSLGRAAGATLQRGWLRKA